MSTRPTTYDPTESIGYLRILCAARESIASTERIVGDPLLTPAQRDELPRLRALITSREEVAA